MRTLKKNTILLFGSGNGKTYSDNSRYLFEYFSKIKNLKETKNIRPIWLTRSKNICRFLTEKGLECYLFYSLFGIYFALLSKANCVCSSLADLSIFAYFTPRHKLIVQLWHGTPLKILENYKMPIIKSLALRLFLRFLGRQADLYISDTVLNVPIYKQFVSEDKIIITGQPRTDLLIKSKSTHDEITILYAPTWREYPFSFFTKEDLRSLGVFLEKKKIVFYIKWHDVQKKEIKMPTSNCIRFLQTDITDFLPEVDILITDYSSVYFDFLLLDRPIIFAPFDLDFYKNSRGFYYPYDEVTPGPKAKTWKEVILQIELLCDGGDRWQSMREEIRNRFHAHKDGQNCKRVYDAIIAAI